MNEVSLEYSKYPGDVKVSKIYIDRDIIDIKKTDLSEDVPTFLAFTQPDEYKNNQVIFNKLTNITPYFFIKDSNVNVYKFKSVYKRTYDKKLLTKTSAVVTVNKTTDQVSLIEAESTKKYIYQGSFSPSNINNTIFNDIGTNILNGEIITFQVYNDISIDAETYIYPDYQNNAIRIFVLTNVDSDSLTVNVSYTNFNLISIFENKYIMSHKIIDYSGDTYDIETTCFSTTQDIVNWEYNSFQPTPEYNSYRVINSNFVSFEFPFKNNYFCIPHNLTYAQYNLYNKKFSVFLLDTDTFGAPIYIYPENNYPKYKPESIKYDKFIFNFNRRGHKTLPIKIPYKVTSIYAIDIITGETLYLSYNIQKSAIDFTNAFSSKTYRIYIEYELPESISEKLSITVDGEKIEDFSFYNTNILEKNEISVSYTGNEYLAFIGKQDTTNPVATISSQINQSIFPIVSDLRKVGLEIGTNRIGNTPYEKTLSPYSNTKYLIYTPALEEYYKRINFDININPKLPMDYIEKNVPFHSDIMWLNLVELNKELIYELTYKIENNYVIIMIDIATDTDVLYYIKNENPLMSDAFLKTLNYFGSSIIDQFDQTLFTDDYIVTKSKKISFAMTPLKVTQLDPEYNMIKISVGLYDKTFNYYGKTNTKEIKIDLTGYGRELYGEGLFGEPN